MLCNFFICCILVQLIFVDSIEVHEDIIEDFPKISKNSNNQDNLVNTTLTNGSGEIHSIEIVSNNVTIVTANLTKNECSEDNGLKNISKQIVERESFQNESSIEVLQKEDDKTQTNSSEFVNFKEPLQRYFMDESEHFQKQASDKILEKENKEIQENFTLPVKYKKPSFPLKTYSTEIKPQATSSTEIKSQVFPQPLETRINKERFMPMQMYTAAGNDFPQPVFIPSPEIKVNNFGTGVLFNKDSFQPVPYPFISLNKKETPTRRVLVDYQDKSRPKKIKNGGNNYPIKSDVFNGNVIKDVQPKRQISQVKRRNEQGYWVLLDNSEEELKPQNKIINYDQHESFYDQDDYRLSAVKPVHEDIRGDHPYPFEYVKDDDSSNWLHSSPPSLEGIEYEDHSYDNLPSPPSPARPHSLTNTDPDWESKFTRGKEIVKPSPLRSILHILGTVVPIGLLLSALTPNVVLINPNATSTIKQTPNDLNLFRGRQRSLNAKETIANTNLADVIRKLTRVRGQTFLTDLACGKKEICQHLALHGGEALDDLQKTIEQILDWSQPTDSEINVSMEELFEAARGDTCSSMFVCE